MTGPVVAHLADLHLRRDEPRAEECVRVLEWIAEDLAEQRPDAIVIAGDVYDRLGGSTAAERLWMVAWLRSLARVAQVMIVSGNHDVPRDLALLGKLSDGMGGSLRVDVWDQPEINWCYDAQIVMLPWPNVAGLAAEGVTDRRVAATDALRDILRGLGAQIDRDIPSLLVGHVNVVGAQQDAGQPVAPDTGVAVTLEDLALAQCVGYALGHIHAAQRLEMDRPCWYAGSPYRTDYGEARGGKSYLLWRWRDGGWLVEPRWTPARNMVLLEATWDATANALMFAERVESVNDADVRLRVTYPPEHRAAVRRAMLACEHDLRIEGAAHVTFDEQPEIVQRVRALDYAATAQAGGGTVEARVRAWAAATEQAVPERLADRLIDLESAS